MAAAVRQTVIYEGLPETTAVILAGGFGTRLRPVVNDRPKVLAEVAGRPFLEYLFEQLTRAGMQQVIISTGYLGGQIQDRYGSSYGDVSLAYAHETSPLGTGGALRLAAEQAHGSRVLALNGDSFVGLDLERFYSAHRDAFLLMPREGASVALVRVEETSRYGRVEFSNTRRIREFKEKQASSGAGWINAGVYLIPRQQLLELPPVKEISLEREVFPAWIAKGELAAFPAEAATFIDIGTPESYNRANALFAGGMLP
jgi:D-glycero-alpha-D-manno-heptose 1-phosphate guanylyltransferase